LNRGVLTGALLGIAALAVGAALLMRQESSTAPLPVTPPMASGVAPAPVLPFSPAAAGAVPPSGMAAAPAQGSPLDARAPWASSAPDVALPPVAVGRAGAPSIDDIQRRLQMLAANPRPSVRDIDAVLADLQKNQGSNVVAGVNLQAVRDNLARSERIQQLALEMQALAATPGPDTAAKLQERMTEMQRLQAGMTSDVAAPGAAR